LPSRFSQVSDNAIGGIGFRFAEDPQPENAQGYGDNCTHWEGRRIPDLSERDKWRSLPSVGLPKEPIEVTRIEISWVPSNGHIAAIEFYNDSNPLPSLSWKQWRGHGTGREPTGLTKETQKPPGTGRWTFIGLMGYWDESLWSITKHQVLSRVSGIWRQQ